MKSMIRDMKASEQLNHEMGSHGDIENIQRSRTHPRVTYNESIRYREPFHAMTGMVLSLQLEVKRGV